MSISGISPGSESPWQRIQGMQANPQSTAASAADTTAFGDATSTTSTGASPASPASTGAAGGTSDSSYDAATAKLIANLQSLLTSLQSTGSGNASSASTADANMPAVNTAAVNTAAASPPPPPPAGPMADAPGTTDLASSGAAATDPEGTANSGASSGSAALLGQVMQMLQAYAAHNATATSSPALAGLAA